MSRSRHRLQIVPSFVVLLILQTRRAEMRANYAILFVAAFAGLIFPDIDRKIGFLFHRSIVTHGFLLMVLLLFLIGRQTKRSPEGDGLRLFAIGYGLATAVHLCFDLFPRRWYGFALIHMPFTGDELLPGYSIAWILAGILICLYAAMFLIKDMREFIFSLVVLCVVFWVAAIAENVTDGRPIIALAGGVLVIGTLIAVAVPHRLLKKTK